MATYDELRTLYSDDALRQRVEDIPLLVHHFLDRLNQDKGQKIEGITREALDRLCVYAWPGNVRELENLMERMAVLRGTGELGVEDLPSHLARPAHSPSFRAPRLPPTGLPFNDVVGRFEEDLILQALEQTHWNKNRAAQLLGLNRTTLLEKIKKKGLEHTEH